jgi:hypothetical protein
MHSPDLHITSIQARRMSLSVPFLDKPGTILGWLMRCEMESANNLTNLVTSEVGLIPWICRTVKDGDLGANYGTKAVNVAAVT